MRELASGLPLISGREEEKEVIYLKIYLSWGLYRRIKECPEHAISS